MSRRGGKGAGEDRWVDGAARADGGRLKRQNEVEESDHERRPLETGPGEGEEEEEFEKLVIRCKH